MAKKRSSSKGKGGVPAPIVFIAVALVLVAIVYFVKGAHIGVMDKAASFDKRLSGVYSKFGLNEKNIIKTEAEEKKTDKESYIYTYREYSASSGLSLRGFESAMKARLKGSEFRVAKSSVVSGRNTELGLFVINSGKMNIMTMKIIKPLSQAAGPEALRPEEKAVPLEAAKPVPPLAPAARRPHGPKVAIVIDDFGYSLNNMPTILSLKQPVTLSILPNTKYYKEVTKEAHARGYEILLHLPMESHHKNLKEEFDTIKTGLSRREIISRIDADIAEIPGLAGVNNHQGSAATENKAVMTAVLTRLKERNLFFLDSMTSSKSVGQEVAASLGEKFAKRDVFLDNSEEPEDIRKQFVLLKKIALKKGAAVAICHDRKNSVKVLSEMLPKLEEEGIQFVALSEMVN
jgi:uncharacterized protein